MAIDKENLRQQVEMIPNSIVYELDREISRHFDKCGLYYRIFSRCKSAFSAISKIETKKYEETGRKMQDLIGVRIALYFKDDIDLCVDILQANYSVVEVVRDEEISDKFSPMRLNLVCKMPERITEQFVPDIWQFPIDKTFEVQVRTIFSEGWHEVEHDLRYKNKRDWEEHNELSRNLNGIFATLETCDWAILNILDQLAYQKYKLGDWDAMLRNHLRIHMDNKKLSNAIVELFDSNHNLGKEFLRVDRRKFLLCMSNTKLHPIPRSLDNMVYIINELLINDSGLSDITPEFIKTHISQIKPFL